MERSQILGMLCGYFLSRFDERAYRRLGYSNMAATHEALAGTIGCAPRAIQNWRDEFDPVHDNSRQGWHKRAMFPSRRRMMEALEQLGEEELFALVQAILKEPSGLDASRLMSLMTEEDASDSTPERTYGLRGPTGQKAEEFFIRHHREHGEPIAGTLLDKRLQQCGYDFEIQGDRARAVVEVKGLASHTGGITFTNKEWKLAREMGDEYYLALVRDVAANPSIRLIQNPARRLCAQMRSYTTIQIGWSVSQSELKGEAT